MPCQVVVTLEQFASNLDIHAKFRYVLNARRNRNEGGDHLHFLIVRKILVIQKLLVYMSRIKPISNCSSVMLRYGPIKSKTALIRSSISGGRDSFRIGPGLIFFGSTRFLLLIGLLSQERVCWGHSTGDQGESVEPGPRFRGGISLPRVTNEGRGQLHLRFLQGTAHGVFLWRWAASPGLEAGEEIGFHLARNRPRRQDKVPDLSSWSS